MTRRGWVLFAAMCVIWGIPYLLIKVAVEDLAPAALVLARTSLAALLLLPVAFARGQVRPLLARWRPMLLYTGVEICVPWLLLGFAEQRLSSSLTGLLVAAVPLVGAALARFSAEHDPLGARRLVGLLVGLAGVGALVGFEVGAGDVRAVAAVAAVAVCYAVGPMILARSLADLPGLGVVAVSLGLAALVYVPPGLMQAPDRWPPASAVAAVVVLAAVCTAVAFLLFFQLIAEVGPARSVVITYVNPAVAVLLGVLVLGEPFTVATGVGFALILAGSVLATSRSQTAPARAAVAAARPEASRRVAHEPVPALSPAGDPSGRRRAAAGPGHEVTAQACD